MTVTLLSASRNTEQETLTQAISRDELHPSRKKTPWLSYWINLGVTATVPSDFAAFSVRYPHRPHYAPPFQDAGVRPSIIIPRPSMSIQNYLLFHAINKWCWVFFSDCDYLKYPDIKVKGDTVRRDYAYPLELSRTPHCQLIYQYLPDLHHQDRVSHRLTRGFTDPLLQL